MVMFDVGMMERERSNGSIRFDASLESDANCITHSLLAVKGPPMGVS